MLTKAQETNIAVVMAGLKNSLADPRPVFPPTNDEKAVVAYKMYMLTQMKSWIEREITETTKDAVRLGVHMDKARSPLQPGQAVELYRNNCISVTVAVTHGADRVDVSKLKAILLDKKVKLAVIEEAFAEATTRTANPHTFKHVLITDLMNEQAENAARQEHNNELKASRKSAPRKRAAATVTD